MIPPPPRSTLFPYTTLFRSEHAATNMRTPPVITVDVVLRTIDPPRSQSQCQTKGKKQVGVAPRSEEHTSELQSHSDLVCRLLLEKKKKKTTKRKEINNNKT